MYLLTVWCFLRVLIFFTAALQNVWCLAAVLLKFFAKHPPKWQLLDKTYWKLTLSFCWSLSRASTFLFIEYFFTLTLNFNWMKTYARFGHYFSKECESGFSCVTAHPSGCKFLPLRVALYRKKKNSNFMAYWSSLDVYPPYCTKDQQSYLKQWDPGHLWSSHYLSD